jgi:6-phosphogluconolactonase
MSDNKRLRIFESKSALAQSAADLILSEATDAISRQGHFNFVLSGGSTPEQLYRLLASPDYRETMPWDRTHFFWGDERCVPPDSANSNFGQARKLLIEPVKARIQNVHRIIGELTPLEAASDYSARLARLAHEKSPRPQFDLVLLGMGEDGHTASLFPGKSVDWYGKEYAVAVEAEYDGRPANRVTLTPFAFNNSRNILFLVTGSKKAETVRAVLEEEEDPVRWPVHLIKPVGGKVIWFLDEAAGHRVKSNQV